MKRNYLILIRCLGIAGIILVILSLVVKQEPERSILRALGSALALALLLQATIFKKKPGLYKDRLDKPD